MEGLKPDPGNRSAKHAKTDKMCIKQTKLRGYLWVLYRHQTVRSPKALVINVYFPQSAERLCKGDGKAILRLELAKDCGYVSTPTDFPVELITKRGK